MNFKSTENQLNQSLSKQPENIAFQLLGLMPDCFKNILKPLAAPTALILATAFLSLSIGCGSPPASNSSDPTTPTSTTNDPDAEAELSALLEHDPSSCESVSLQTCMDNLLVKWRQDINLLAADKSCDRVEDCTSAGVGQKICGGPQEFVVFSQSMVNLEDLSKSINTYNSLQGLYRENFSPGLAGTCSVNLAPALACVSNTCQTAPSAP